MIKAVAFDIGGVLERVDWIVAGARAFGIQAVLHESTEQSIAAITALLGNDG